MGARDARVDEYIAGRAEWQQAVCREVREPIHAAEPEIEETIKRMRQPYSVLPGNVCALLGTTDRVNVFPHAGGRRKREAAG